MEIKGLEFFDLDRKSKDRAKKFMLYADINRHEKLTDKLQNFVLRRFLAKSNLKVEWRLSNTDGDGVNIYGDVVLSDILYALYIYTEELKSHRAFKVTRGLSIDEIKELIELVGEFKFTIPNNQYPELEIELLSDITNFYSDLVAILKRKNIPYNEELLLRFQRNYKRVFQFLADVMKEYGYKFMNEMSDDEAEDIADYVGYLFEEDGTVIYKGERI